MPRLLVDTKVRIISNNQYKNRVGLIKLHFHQDYSKITVEIGNLYKIILNI